MWVCSHSDKYREKPSLRTVLPSLLAEHTEIGNEVQHGAWSDSICREGRTRAGAEAESSNVGREEMMAVISLKLTFGPPSVGTRLCLGTYIKLVILCYKMLKPKAWSVRH